MIAKVKRTKNGCVVDFVRPLTNTVEEVWAMLTENEQLAKWFQELRVSELREGGFMRFYIPDTMDERLEITDYKPLSVLEFDWFGDVVRFEIQTQTSGVELILKETVNNITEQTKKDIAGWHVCLDVIQALLEGKTIQREEEWEKWHMTYVQLIDELMTLG